ncbi:MAG: hypothetical protein N4A62_17910 [Marinisporobacter sp.]|nr:hypothetical protein [Marinisporobacter sp.]
MKIYVNEKPIIVNEKATAFGIRDFVKKEADIVVLNGFILREDAPLKKEDRLTLVIRGEIPNEKEIEAMIIANYNKKEKDENDIYNANGCS